jgi:hypothetical protein
VRAAVGVGVALGLAVLAVPRSAPVIASPFDDADGDPADAAADGEIVVLAEADAEGFAVLEAVLDGEGVGVAVGVTPPTSSSRTGRKSSFAVVARVLSTAESVTPGIDTMMLAFCPLPWVVTSDSATPKPSTR